MLYSEHENAAGLFVVIGRRTPLNPTKYRRAGTGFVNGALRRDAFRGACIQWGKVFQHGDCRHRLCGPLHPSQGYTSNLSGASGTALECCPGFEPSGPSLCELIESLALRNVDQRLALFFSRWFRIAPFALEKALCLSLLLPGRKSPAGSGPSVKWYLVLCRICMKRGSSSFMAKGLSWYRIFRLFAISPAHSTCATGNFFGSRVTKITEYYSSNGHHGFRRYRSGGNRLILT